MKRYFISCLVVILLMSSLVFPGCGGKNSGKTQIKIYEVTTSGGVGYVPDNINQNGVVFADSLSEIGNEYILFTPNNAGSSEPTIQAFCYDSNGNKQNVAVNLTMNDTSIFENFNPINLEGGGTSVNLMGKQPGGKSVLTARYNDLVRQVNIWVYNSWGNAPFYMSRGNGIKLINTQGVRALSNNTERDISIVFRDNDTDGKVRLVGNCVAVVDGNCTDLNWKEKFKNINEFTPSTIDLSDTSGVLWDGINATYQIYIAKVPDPINGYIKIIGINNNIVWAYVTSGNTSFE